MIKDFLISFKDNIKDKTTNPFLGTYFAVWMIRNWKLVYTVFNFDEEKSKGVKLTLEDKINAIEAYYQNESFLGNLGINLLWAFGVLILTYIVLNLSRFIVNFSEKQVTPWIIQFTDSKSIVSKERYNQLKEERDDLEVKFEKEEEANSLLKKEIAELNQKIPAMEEEWNSVKVELEDKVKTLEETKVSLEKRNSKLKSGQDVVPDDLKAERDFLQAKIKESEEALKSLKRENRTLTGRLNNYINRGLNESQALYSDDETQEILDSIKSTENVKNYIKLYENSDKGSFYSSLDKPSRNDYTKSIKYYIDLGLIEIDSSYQSKSGVRKCDFTELGKNVYKML